MIKTIAKVKREEVIIVRFIGTTAYAILFYKALDSD